MQPESASTDPMVPPPAAPQPQAPVGAIVAQPVPPPLPQRKGNCLSTILVSLLILMLLATAAGLGYWGYTLNNNLTKTKQDIVTLQGKHDKLVTDNASLTTDLTKTNADLDKSNTDLDKTGKDLTTTQGDLAKVQQSSKEVQDRITQTSKLMDVAVSIFVSNDTWAEIGQRVKGTNDTQLNSLWDKFFANKNNETWATFLNYLFTTISDNINKK